MNKLKKIVLSLIALMIIIGCSGADAKNKETATYLESVDEYNFEAIKLVDKETGCKYLVIYNTSAGRSSVTQMMGKDGLPLCK